MGTEKKEESEQYATDKEQDRKSLLC